MFPVCFFRKLISRARKKAALAFFGGTHGYFGKVSLGHEPHGLKSKQSWSLLEGPGNVSERFL